MCEWYRSSRPMLNKKWCILQYVRPSNFTRLLANCKSDPEPARVSQRTSECPPAGRRARPYHVTAWNRSRVLNVREVHGSHSACPVTGEEKVPAITVQQAVCHPDTHLIGTPVFTAALVHSPLRRNEPLWFWRRGGGSGDHSLFCRGETM